MCIVTTLSNNIKRLRSERGWSQEMLALEAEIHRNYLGKIERKSHVIGIVSLDKIAHALQVPISSLLEEQGENNETPTDHIYEKSS